MCRYHWLDMKAWGDARMETERGQCVDPRKRSKGEAGELRALTRLDSSLEQEVSVVVESQASCKSNAKEVND